MLIKYVIGLCFSVGLAGCAMQPPAEVVKVRAVKKIASRPPLEELRVTPGESLTVLRPSLAKTPVKKHTVSETTPYSVKRGDTLYTIARQVGTSVEDLGRLNNLSAPFKIYEGQHLRLTENASGHPGAVPVTPPQQLTIQPVKPAAASWHWPTEGNIVKQFQPGKKKVNGLVIQNLEGTPVVAAKNGVVVYSGDALRGYGNLIIVKHDQNYLSAYAHNRKNIVKEGDNVLRGQRIAEMGKTGSHQVQLHFEIRYQGDPIDPQTVLPRKS